MEQAAPLAKWSLVMFMLPVVFLVVVAAVMSARNRGVLGALAAVLGFGLMGLVGICLLIYILRVGTLDDEEATFTRPIPAIPPVPPIQPIAPIPSIKPIPPFSPREAPQAEAEAPATDPTASNARPTADVAATASPTPRPAWMDEPQGKRGSDGAYHKIASVELYRSRAECEEALPAELRKAVKQYIDQFLGDEGAAELVAMPVSDIHEHLIKGQWEEHTSDVLGPIVNLHTLLVFDGKANAEIKDRYQHARVAERLTSTGIGAGLLLGLLGTVFGYLKLDTLTRGYYSRRLQFAAGSVILALAAIVALFAQGKLGF